MVMYFYAQLNILYMGLYVTHCLCKKNESVILLLKYSIEFKNFLKSLCLPLVKLNAFIYLF